MVLTNGIIWCLYNVVFAKPIDKRLVAEIDLLRLDLTDDREVEQLYALSKEGVQKGAHLTLKDRQEALSRHLLAALLLQNRRLLTALRREVHRIVNFRVDPRELRQVLRQEVIKRDILEDPAYAEALTKVRPAHLEHVEGGQAAAQPPGRRARRPSRASITLRDLIEAHVIAVPVELHRSYKGTRFVATLRPDGLIEWEGRTYNNPSKVASELRERVLGRAANTNGWTFWRYGTPDGATRTLADAREAVQATGGAEEAAGDAPGQAG